MRKPIIDINPPLLLKGLGAFLGLAFAWATVQIARSALRQPADLSLWAGVVAAAIPVPFMLGILVVRRRVYVVEDSLLIEGRDFSGVTRRSVPFRSIRLELDRQASWGLFARATVPSFTVKDAEGEVLFSTQYVGVERVAEELARQSGRRLNETS